MRRRLKAQSDAQKTQPVVVRSRARQRQRRKRQLALLLLVILILLLLRLDCVEEPSPSVFPSPSMAVPAPRKHDKPGRGQAKRNPLRLEGRVEGSDRTSLALDPLAPPTWLPEFRLQVAARSPRLAACFVGTERPGAMRWSALVHARSGRATESVVEPVFRGASLAEDQLDCLVKGLTEQPYVLDPSSPEVAARRVSLIFEF